MNIVKFSIYTIIGAGLWNAFLTVVGFYLKEHWIEVRHYGEIADVVVIILSAAGIGFLVYRYWRRHRQ